MTASAGREIAVEDGHGAFRLERCGEGTDDVLVGDCFRVGDGVSEGTAGDGGRRSVKKRGEFAQESGQTAGVVEMLHVMRTGGLEIEEDGNLAAELVEGVEVERNAGAGSNCGEVDESVGGPADGLEDDTGVADRGGSDEIAGAG